MLKGSSGSFVPDDYQKNTSSAGTWSYNPYIPRDPADQGRRVFRWLSPTFFDAEEAYESIVGLLTSSTCEWIESDEKFHSWFLSDSAALLGICGEPGCGKSVLAAKIGRALEPNPKVDGTPFQKGNRNSSIKNFYKQQIGPHYWEDLYDVPHPVAYMFCDSLPIEERTSSVILSVLLAQLCRQNSELLAAATSRMGASQHAYASPEDLATILRQDVTRILHRYYLIIDGLDRIDGFAGILCSIMKSKSDGPKILTFSRSSDDLLTAFPMLEITQAHTTQDIKVFLQAQVADIMRGHDPQTRQAIEIAMISDNKGSFLWCRVLAKHLEQYPDLTKIESTIPNGPTQIFHLYSMIFEHLSAEPDDFKRSIAVRSLAWIAIAQRPLDISELEVALSITPDNNSVCYDAQLKRLVDILRDLCGPLLDINETAVHGGIMSVFCTTITLIHPTLEDFLFSPSSPGSLGLPLNRQQLHANAAKVCVAYLSLPELRMAGHEYKFQRGRTSSFSTMAEGFLSYAAVYAVDHIKYGARAVNPGLEDEIKAISAVTSWGKWRA